MSTSVHFALPVTVDVISGLTLLPPQWVTPLNCELNKPSLPSVPLWGYLSRQQGKMLRQPHGKARAANWHRRPWGLERPGHLEYSKCHEEWQHGHWWVNQGHQWRVLVPPKAAVSQAGSLLPGRTTGELRVPRHRLHLGTSLQAELASGHAAARSHCTCWELGVGLFCLDYLLEVSRTLYSEI